MREEDQGGRSLFFASGPIVNRIFGLGMYVAVNGLGYAGAEGAGGPFFHLPGGKVTLVLHEMG